MVLVTGAAGKTGRATIAALTANGQQVRAFINRERQWPSVSAAGAATFVVGDLGDSDSLKTAVNGISAIYHICPNMHPDEVAIGKMLITVAQQAGVQHFVYHSVLHPQTETMPHHWHKLRVEEALVGAGIPFTILQPTAYMQNILTSWDKIQKENVYTTPYPVTTAISLVDLVDVAAVAAQVVGNAAHFGATYQLVGTRPLPQTAVAAALSQHLKRPIAAQEIPLPTWETAAKQARVLSPYAIETLAKMFRYYAQHGLVGNPMVLSQLLERPPTPLNEFLARERPFAGDK